MFHAAILEIGQDDKVVFCERIGDTRIGFHVVKRVEDQAEYSFLLDQLGWIRFAVVHRNGPVATLGKNPFKLAGHKREKIGAEGLGLGEKNGFSSRTGFPFFYNISVGNGCPVLRNRQRKRIVGFQVRLVETREECASPVGNQQRIEELVTPVERLVAGREDDFDVVRARYSMFFRNYNMLVYNG